VTAGTCAGPVWVKLFEEPARSAARLDGGGIGQG
jgi:hypothetical protein